MIPLIDNPTDPAAVDWTRRIEGHATDIGFDSFRGLATTINFGPYVYLHDDIVQYWVEDSSALNEYGDKLPNGRKEYFRDATGSDSFTWFTTTELNATVVGATDSRASRGDPSYRQIDPGPVMVADFERYIDERVTASNSDPFFAYVALYSPHKPWAITPEFNHATYGSYDYARFMAEVNDRIGRILAAIDNHGLTNDTLVIFTADNGPETTAMSRSLSNSDDSNGPLRGAKRDVWEGGTRVHLLGVLDQLRTTGAATLDGREPDNDADGMSNAFETTHGLDRDSPKDAALDHDGDGADNLSESIAGSDPNNPGSFFRVIATQDAATTFSVTWPSVADREYEVFWSTDLATWTSDSTHAGTGADITIPLDKNAIDAADGIPGDLRSLFVRVAVVKP